MATAVDTQQYIAQPVWQVATLFPNQGEWSERDYLELTADTNRLVEFARGHIEFLPMPKTPHQIIVQYFSNLLLAFVGPRKLGRVLFAPLRVRLPQGSYREPDVVFMLANHADSIGEDYWEGADLVMEVLSEDNRDHDLVTKRAEYAAAGIPEYWIIDPRDHAITVLHLSGGEYTTDGPRLAGQQAPSRLLDGFAVDVSAVFAAAQAKS